MTHNRTWLVLVVWLASSVTAIADERVWTFLQNEDVKIGAKRASGGAVGWLSRVGTDQNLVNHFDHGRLIQQSYYGIQDGSKWAGKPWRWNPVQGGDYLGRPAEILKFEQMEESLYVKTKPMHWAGTGQIDDVVMEQWITLQGPVAHLRYRMTYSGDATHPQHDQEIPAVFVDRSLGNLIIGQPEGVQRLQPGFPNERYPTPENWAAYVDDDDFGLGVYVPQADVLTSYRVGAIGQRGACSYFAPLAVFAIQPGMVYEYDCFLTIGSLTEIRNRFEKLQTKPISE